MASAKRRKASLPQNQYTQALQHLQGQQPAGTGGNGTIMLPANLNDVQAQTLLPLMTHVLALVQAQKKSTPWQERAVSALSKTNQAQAAANAVLRAQALDMCQEIILSADSKSEERNEAFKLTQSILKSANEDRGGTNWLLLALVVCFTVLEIVRYIWTGSILPM